MKKRTYHNAASLIVPYQRPTLMQEMQALVESTKYMALHPAEAAKMEMERSDIGYKTGALWLLPSFAIFALFVGLIILILPTLGGAPGLTMPEQLTAFLFYSVGMCIGWALIALLTMLIVHISARLLGGQGEMKRLFHLLARVLLVRAPLEIVSSILSLYLPGLMIGAVRYSPGGLLLDLYYVYAIAQIVPEIYGLNKSKGWLVGVLFWVILVVLGVVAGMAKGVAGAGA